MDYQPDSCVVRYVDGTQIEWAGMRIGAFFLKPAAQSETVNGAPVVASWLLHVGSCGIQTKTVDAAMLVADEFSRFAKDPEALLVAQNDREVMAALHPRMLAWLTYVQEQEHKGLEYCDFRKFLSGL